MIAATGEHMELEAWDLHEGVSAVRLKGRLDVAGAASVETRMLAATVAKGRPAVVDLSEVEFIASMGIGLLIAAAKGLALRQCRIAVYGARPLVRDVLENTAIDQVVAVCDTPEDALKRVRG